MGHAVEEERGVPVVGCLHLVSCGVSLMGPRSTDNSGGYGGGPAPVCRPCAGDGTCGWLEGSVGCIRWSAWKPVEAFNIPVS